MPSGEWEVFDEGARLVGGFYGPTRVRMLAFGVEDGGLCVVSPGTPLDEARFRALERWGEPRFLLAPNKYHNAGIPSWKQRYPQVVPVAHPRAIARLRRKFPDVRFEELAALQSALPEGVRLLAPPSARQGETWVSVRIDGGCAWFVTDAMLNETRLPGGVTGLALRTLGFRAELMTNRLFWRLFVADKPAYKAWVRAEIERDPPTLFVPSHGAVLRGADVASRLLAITDAA